MRLRILPLLLSVTLLGAGEDPFEAPPELKVFARQHTTGPASTQAKVSALLRALFHAPEDGGLGITYDNSYTRTVAEAWRDRKANCLSLTAMYISACKSVGLEARFAESLRISRWRRVGSTIRYERHVVAIIPTYTAGQELVADFLPEIRRGGQLLAPLDPKRVLALFHSNRAVELLDEFRPSEALAEAEMSIQVDPNMGIGWNILGVVQRGQGLEQEAETSFRRAIQADPNDGAPCGNLESLLRAQGREAEAQAFRDRGMEVRKNDPFFNAFLAQEALQDGQWEEASKRIKTAIKLLPHEPEFFLIRARVNLAQGKTKDAIKDLENARKWANPEEQARFDSKLDQLRKEGQ